MSKEPNSIEIAIDPTNLGWEAETLLNPDPENLLEVLTWTLPHKRAMQPLIQHAFFPNENCNKSGWKYLFVVGEKSLNRNQFAEAASNFRQALEVVDSETDVTPLPKRMLTDVRLAHIDRIHGNFAEAEEKYKRLLPLLDNDNALCQPALKHVLHDLALICWKQNRHAEAEDYLIKRLHAERKQYGMFSFQTSDATNDLANCLYYQRKLSQADNFYIECLAYAQRMLPKDWRHAYALKNLASCRIARNRFADALVIYEELKVRESFKSTTRDIEKTKKALANVAAHERQARDLPPPIGDRNYCEFLMVAAADDIKKGRPICATYALATSNHSPSDSLSAAIKESIASGDPELIARVNMLAANGLGERNNISSDLLKQTILALDTAGSAYAQAKVIFQARLILSLIAEGDVETAERKFAVLRDIATGEVWTDLVMPIFFRKLFHPRRDNIRANSLLAEICRLSLVHAPDKSMVKAIAQSNLAQVYLQMDIDSRQNQRTIERFVEIESLWKASLETANASDDRDEDLLRELEGLFGQFYVSNGNFVDAEPLLLRTFAYSEAHPDHRFHVLHSLGHSVSHLYQIWGRPDEQLKYFARTHAKHAGSDRDPQVFRQLAAIKESSGELDEAIANLERIREMPGNQHFEAFERLFTRTGQTARLAQLFEELNEDASAISCYLAVGDFDTALKKLERQITEKETRNETKDKQQFGCVSLPPQYSHYMYQLANCLLDGYGEFDRAIEAIENGIKASFQVPMNTPLNGVSDKFGVPEENLQTSELVTLLICCDGAGDLERAGKYRAMLTKRLSNKNQSFDLAVAAINRRAMTRAEQVELMELVAIAHARPVVLKLLERALAIRTRFSIVDNDAMNQSFEFLCGKENIHKDKREGAAISRIEWLIKIEATDAEIAAAKLKYGEMLLQRQEYFAARRVLVPLVVHLTTENQLVARQRIIDCCREMDQYEDALEHLEALRDAYTADSKAYANATIELAVCLDLMGRHDEALNLYRQVSTIDTENKDDLLTPLRRATDRAVERRQLRIADLLNDRQTMYLNNSP